jgi:uncharacterized repeat protein (TIGR01451 family)
LISSEGRVNVNRRWLGASMKQVGILAAALALVGAGWLLLGITRGSGIQTAHGVAPATGLQALSRVPGTAISAVDPKTRMHAGALMSGLPLMFEPNEGQGNLNAGDSRVKFVARGSGYVLALGSEGAIVTVRSHAGSSKSTQFDSVGMKLAGANPHPSIQGADLLAGKSNYLLGNDPAKWRRGVPQFSRVSYENVYPGINLVFYGNQGHLEHDFQVAPGADPSRAELEFEGAQKLELRNGALVIHAPGGEMLLEAPRIYQKMDGREQAVAGRFVLRGGNRAGFSVGDYDHTRELVIDPVLNFSSYFGGAGDELATSVAVDSAGFVYLAGSTDSTNLPIVAGVPVYQSTLSSTPPATNVYIAKLNPTAGANGSSSSPLVYVTYLGGNGSDTPAPFGGIAVDGAGDVYVAGTTTSSNFPTTTTAYQTAPASAGQHVFVTELNGGPTPPAASQLVYSSYLSGNGTDIASGMTIDTAADIYVTGTTSSNNAANITVQFPASSVPISVPAYQPAPKGGPLQFFVTKVSTTSVGAGSIFYSTYFGGGQFTPNTTLACPGSTPDASGLLACGGGIAVDTNLNIYFSGTTNFVFTGVDSGTDFPILNAYQPCLDIPQPVVQNVNPTCTGPQFKPANPQDPDAFVAKLTNPNGVGVLQGQQLQWSTYLGGSNNDFGNAVAVDPGAANVYVVGTTNSTDFTLPTGTGQFQTKPGGGNDAFVARFPNLTPTTANSNTLNLALAYFSYLGGSGDEAGLAIVADNTNGALVTGSTQSANFPFYPTTGAIQTALAGSQDAFVARLNTAVPPGANNQVGSWSTYFGGATSDNGSAATTLGTGIALDANQNAYFAGSTNTTDLQKTVATSPLNANQGGYDAFVTEMRAAPGVTIAGVATLGTNQTFFPAGNPATFTYTITNVGQDPAYNLVVIDNLAPANSSSNVALTFNSASSTAGSCNPATTNGSVSCTLGALQPGSIATVTFVVTPTANTSGTPQSFNGGQVSVIGQNNILLAVTSVPAQMSDFAMTAFPSNVSIPAGQTATYQVQMAPHPVYGTNVSLSCSNVPTSASCNFTPSNSISLQGSSPASATLNLTTTPQTIITASSRSGWRSFYAVFLGVPGLALAGFGIGGGRRRRWRVAGLFVLLMVIAQLLPLPGCSTIQTQPPPTGTPSGQYTITVTATSGTDSKSIPIQLTVSPSL